MMLMERLLLVLLPTLPIIGHAESSAFLGYLYLSKEKAGINADKAKH